MASRKITTRERLVDIVIEYAGDEFETVSDALELAKETEDELLGRVENILEYYKQEAER